MKEERKVSIGIAEYRRLKRLDDRLAKMKVFIIALHNISGNTGKDVRVKTQTTL